MTQATEQASRQIIQMWVLPNPLLFEPWGQVRQKLELGYPLKHNQSVKDVASPLTRGALWMGYPSMLPVNSQILAILTLPGV